MLVERQHTLLRGLVHQLKSRFEFILLDTSPDSSPYTVSSLCAADSVLIPLQCEYLAFKNLRQTVDTLKWVKTQYRPSLNLAGVVLTMVVADSLTTRRITAAAHKHLQRALYTTTIPRSEKFAETPGYRKPLVVQDRCSSLADSYRALAQELIARVTCFTT
ncbi:MAG: ParA family protein [Syntrophotaleaceae bacterium]